jgi:hypothetical protein
MNYDKTKVNQVAIDKSIQLLMKQEELSFDEAKELVDKVISYLFAFQF